MKRIISIFMIIFIVLANMSFDAVNVFAAQSTAPAASNVIITNNLAGKSDTVYIFGLDPGTLIKVYSSNSENKILAYGTVPNNKVDISFTVPQLGADGGSIFISAIVKGDSESSRTRVDFDGEPKSDALPADAVSVTNNAQKSDIIYVSGLNPRDVVKVYSAASGGKLLGSRTVSTTGSEVSINVSQVGSSAGSVYVTVTAKGYAESKRTRVNFDAEPASVPLDTDSITINNNAKKADTIYISGLSGGDVVKVYNAQTGGKMIGSKSVSSTSYDATITVAQLGTQAGVIYFTVTNTECAESIRIPVQFEAELSSDRPVPEYITVMNNSGKPDTVTVTGLNPSDIVKVYNSDVKGSLLGSGTVPTTDGEVTVSISQLSTTGGAVYVSVTSAGKNESLRVKATYAPESKSGYISPAYITVTNNVGKADTIYISNLSEGDIIKAYDRDIGGNLLGSATVPKSGTDATISVSQLGIDSGMVYLSVINSGRLESTRTGVGYLGESKSSALDANAITVSNNAGSSDTVYVTGLPAGTVVRVYSAPVSGYLLGSATVSASRTDATITISQLGTASGTIYVSVTQPGAQESGRTKADYSAEGTSTAPNVNNISITNNVGKADTVYISNLASGDIVRIYNAAVQGTIIGSATVAGTASDITVSISQLGAASGSVYVTVTNTGKTESTRVKADYRAENVYSGVDSSSITVTNNAGKADTVYFTRLSAGDMVKVYDSKLGGTLLGSAVVAGGLTDTTVSIQQLGKGAGNVYVTVSSLDQSESERVEVSYSSEASTEKPAPEQIVVTNNITGTADTILVSGLNPEAVIKAYSGASQGILLGTAAVPANGVSAIITVAQLGTGEGSVYISVTNSGKLESQRTEAKYLGESRSQSPEITNITINNNSGAADTVKVSGLTADDLVKVYTAATGGNLLGSATVTTFGSEAVVTITQLGTLQGKVYVSITSKNKSESNRVEASYYSEPATAPVSSSNISVANNAGVADTVQVTGLTPGDQVKVYDSAAGGNLLGSSAVSASSTQAVVEIPQIGTTAGTAYVSITSVNKSESTRTSAAYSAEASSKAPEAQKVFISNNYGIASTITVGGLKENDVVGVYSAETGGSLLGSGTVSAYGSELTISVSRLSDAEGTVYISVKSPGMLESSRTPVAYSAKPASSAPEVSNIEIYNNVGIPDEIVVSGMEPNAVIKVYSLAAGGSPIGSSTVPADGSEAVVYITQLGSGGGTVYISVTTSGKTESPRAAITYTEEEVSEPLAPGNVEIVNNSGLADTVTVSGLQAYDVVRIYNAATGGTRLALLTADNSGLVATANISQLGTGSGSIYVTVTNYGKSESKRIQVQYEAESVAPLSSNISIVNNAGMADTITVKGLNENDVVKVYDAASNGNLIGWETVLPGSSRVTISVTQLTVAAGRIYVSVSNYGRAESSLTKASYIAETSTVAPYIGDIYIVNNVDLDDTITVYNLNASDVVKVYDKASGGNLLGYATVPANKTEVTVSVEDLGSTAGIVYISAITKGRTESSRTEASYVAEGKSTAPYSGNIYITNNVVLSDTVLVSGLSGGDKVKIYDSSSGGVLLGSATAASNGNQVKITIKQLGEEAGSIYISITSKGKTESKRTEVEYVSEQTTNEPYSGYIKVVNNKTGTFDTITVSNLSEGDIINVYSAAAGGSLLGSATVASGSTAGTVSIAQLGTSAGSVYISVTSAGKAESNRTKADYLAE